MKHSSDENAIHGRENVLNRYNEAFSIKFVRKMRRKRKKLRKKEIPSDEMRILHWELNFYDSYGAN